MSSAIIKIFLAALAAGAATALPQPPTMVSSSMSMPSESAATPPSPAADLSFADLVLQPTTVDRFKKIVLGDDGKVLPQEELAARVIFDFDAQKAAAPGSRGGAVASANVKTFPILTGLDISTTVGFLGPCGLNTPHIHPRATEFLTLANGTLDFGFILENGLVDAGKGSAEVAGRLHQFQGAVFPIGSIHYQVNPTCDPVVFIATLNSEDPGVSQVAQNFFGLDGDVVSATLGFPESLDGKDIESFRKQIPANLAVGIEQCLATCGIPKTVY
ncbi:RmlC-like cupin [Aulographum hederae CBS 113979]|uniref:RmlC-like cupin n=1 Tax=Aulographum hederae CBS 113979 TaxID=1176131 RepID=A0A6G1GU37_9PEZI|nr:RmlC-like cupin [Aulographum hederae CBS 113979]